MKVLITNNELSTRSGTELYVKEVAEELKKRGHTVAAYSNRVGELATKMNQLGIQTVDDLSKLSWIPDVIHGQHHLETMTAIAHFPNVPAVFFCHGWRNWVANPPFHPRIMRYFAVDSATLSSAVQQHGVPPDQIQLVHNFVDLDRFKQRGPLPDKPAKALIFSNYASEANYLPLVRQACLKAGIELDTIGLTSGNAVDRPEDILRDYDLVFAVGRSALEALATGASVVICGMWGVGPMVTLKDMNKLRDQNFGSAAIYSKPDVDAIYREICRYNAKDSAALTKSLREVVDIKQAVDRVEQIYVDAIEKYKTVDISNESEARAFSSYLRNISTFIKLEPQRKDQDLQRLTKEIKSMKSSRFWKLRKKCLSLKDKFSRVQGVFFGHQT
jgi:hypothetical protein